MKIFAVLTDVDNTVTSAANTAANNAYLQRLESYWREDMRWLWVLLGLLLLVSILTFLYVHFHHRHFVDTYQDTCATPATTTVVHDYSNYNPPVATPVAPAYNPLNDPTYVARNYDHVATLNDRLARGEITEDEYGRIKSVIDNTTKV